MIGDETLIKIVGRTAVITYDLPSWVVMDVVAAPPNGRNADGGVFQVTTIATGTVHTSQGLELVDRPLAIRLNAGSGRAIYTTFHNEAQLDPAVEAILQYFVMSL